MNSRHLILILLVIAIDFLMFILFPVQKEIQGFLSRDRRRAEIESFQKPFIKELSANVIFNLKNENRSLPLEDFVSDEWTYLLQEVNRPLYCAYIPQSFSKIPGLIKALNQYGLSPYLLLENPIALNTLPYNKRLILGVRKIPFFEHADTPVFFTLNDDATVSNVFLSYAQPDRNQFYLLAMKRAYCATTQTPKNL